MNLFWKILKGITKFIILFICSILIAFFSAKIPIAGIDPLIKIPIMNIELYPLASSSSLCGDIPVGLPFAYESKFKNRDRLLESAMICSNPGRILKRLLMFFFDIIFWLAFLHLSIHFGKKLLNFSNRRKFIYTK